MRPSRRNVLVVGLASVLGLAVEARGQEPVCEPLDRHEAVVTACRPGALYPVIRFVSDFTVDHLFKPSPPPFERDLRKALQAPVPLEPQEDDDLSSFLGSLPPLRFSQLDRTTGTVTADLDQVERTFEATVPAGPGTASVRIEMPERIEGGYWRAPDAIQIAFWKNRRVAVDVVVPGATPVKGEVRCVAISPDGVLIRLAPKDTPAVLVRLRGCS